MTELDPALAGTLAELFGLHPDDLRPDADLVTDLQLDSLAVTELQVALEDRVGLRIRPEDPSAVRTLADVQRMLDDARRTNEPAIPVLRLSED